VTIVVASTLLLLFFLDNPYERGIGGLRPVAMQRSVRQLTTLTALLGKPIVLPCRADGLPRT
jgi:hypothetical protein